MKQTTVIMVLGVIMLFGCSQQNNESSVRPPITDQPTNLENIGNGWYSFEYRNECFIYHTKTGGVTRVKCE